jgi:CubicO group peptidase (beta-lactamase class C family)
MRIITTTTLICFLSFNVQSQDVFKPFSKQKEEKTTNSFNEYIKGINQLIEFSGGIKIYRKDELIFDYYKGVESNETGKKISETSRFPIASLTKPFTAMMILKLAEKGKIDLEKTIFDYLPYYPKELGSKVKIIHLINNSSGIPDYTNRYEEVSVSNLNTKNFILKFCTETPRFEPGISYEYSNTGFYILGAIIEKLTGKTFKQAIESEIMSIANMKNSGIFERKRQYHYNLVDGHEDMVKAKPFNPITVYAAGNAYSTTQDMVNWYRAIMDYKIIERETVNELFSGKPLQYYKGWGYQNIYGQIGFGHTGGITGFNTQMITIPEEDIFVIILANNSILPLQKMGKDLTAIAIGKEVIVPSKKNEISVPPMILQKFVGSYEHESGNKLQIGIKEGKLYLHLFGNKRLLKAETMNKFYIDQFGPTLDLSFEGGGLTWNQDGDKFNYRRINSDNPQQGSTKIINLTHSEIKNLTGKYSKGKSVIEISWKSNKLIFKKDSDNEENLLLKKEYSFYYEANENGFQSKYPVEFRKSGESYQLIYDGNIIYSKD